VRMRFISSPAAFAAIRQRAAPAAFGDRLGQALAVRRTLHRPPHEPSAFARLRSQGDHRTPGPPAQRTPGCRKRVSPRRRPPEPDLCSTHRSAAASTRTTRQPKPRWCRAGTLLAASSAPFRRPSAPTTLENAAAGGVRLTDELLQPRYTSWPRRTVGRPGGAEPGAPEPLDLHSSSLSVISRGATPHTRQNSGPTTIAPPCWIPQPAG
jgi:hypothetical protein